MPWITAMSVLGQPLHTPPRRTRATPSVTSSTSMPAPSIARAGPTSSASTRATRSFNPTIRLPEVRRATCSGIPRAAAVGQGEPAGGAIYYLPAVPPTTSITAESSAMTRAHATRSSGSSRRQFLKTSAVAAGALTVPLAHGQGRDILKIGLIGCGGRGTGAASQALRADPNVKLWALGDAFRDRLDRALATLRGDGPIAEKIDVTPQRCFVGF